MGFEAEGHHDGIRTHRILPLAIWPITNVRVYAEFVDTLPKTGTGKILKKDLRKKYWQGRETMRPSFAAAAKPKPGA